MNITEEWNKDNRQLLEWLHEAETSTPEVNWRSEALEDYRFYAGHQDSAEVLAALTALSRPPSVFNEIKPKIDMLVGLAAQTKHEMLAVPVGPEDEPLAEVMNGMLKHFRKELSLSRKELECFEHTTKSGRSLLHFYVDDSNPFEPKICVRRVPGTQFFIDPNCVEYDLSDARYVFIDRWLREEEIKALWPGFDVNLVSSGTVPDMPLFFNEQKKLYRLVECWYYRFDKVVWFVNPLTGKPESLKQSDFSKFLGMLRMGIPVQGQTVQMDELEHKVSYKKVFYYSIFSGTNVLEEGQSPYLFERYPSVLFGAYKDEDENRWFGVISTMKDPQEARNTTRRQYIHLLQTLPKGILVHEVGAVLNIEEYEERSSDPSFHLEISKGMFDRVKFEQQPAISPVYGQLDALFSQDMKDASGIQNEMMGVQTTSREPGVSIRMRHETGMSVLYSLFDNYRESRTISSKILMGLIQQFVTTPTIVRVEGQQGIQLLQVNTQMNPQVEGFNDISAGKFDLTVEDIAETPTARMTVSQMLAEMNHNNPGMIPPDLILEYADVPYSAKQRVKANFESMLQAQQADKAREAKLQEEEIKLKYAELELKAQDVASKERVAHEKAKSSPREGAKGGSSGGGKTKKKPKD